MSGYVMHCTLCKNNYPTLPEWNDHLLTTFHQNKAKIDLWKWGKDERKCSVIIYSSSAITALTATGIVQYFSRIATVIVTDVILSHSRFKLAILQFESRKKVKEVTSLVSGPTIKIDSQLFQFKGLNNMLELEWQELLYGFQESVASSTHRSSIQKVPLTVEPMHMGVPSRQLLLCGGPRSVGVTLQAQMQHILECLKISDAEFKIVRDTMTEIKRVLEEANSRRFSVELYRHNFLQLRNNMEAPQYLSFIYIHGDDGEDTFHAATNNLKEPLNPYFTIDGVTTCGNSILQSFSVIPGINERDTRTHIRHKNVDIEIILSTFPLTLSEQRLSSMVAYYCKFDSRIKQILSCVYYWSQVNNIHIANKKHGPRCRGWRKLHQSVPEPAALEWILLFFLCHCEKMIPSPKEILKQPHKRIKFSFATEDDVGFSEDPKFVPQWKAKQKFNDLDNYSEGTEEYSMSIVRILQRFFAYYGETLRTPCTLNTQEGKIIGPGGNARVLNAYHLTYLGSKGFTFIITHPLIKRWKISADSRNWHKVVVPAMQTTSRKLKKFINMWEQCPSKITKEENLLTEAFRVL